MTGHSVPVRQQVHVSWLSAFLTVLIPAAIAVWATSPYVIGVFHDDGVYALLARSLASGHGFHYSHLVGTPAATHYPPLYPLLVSVAWRVWPDFPANVSVLIRVNALLLGIAALGLWYLAVTRASWKSAWAAAAAIACTISTPTLTLATSLLSETLFLALLWPALALGERAAESDDTRAFVGAGVASGLLMLVRAHAIAVLAAIIILQFCRARWRGAIVTACSAVLTQVPWLAFTAWARPRVAPPLEGAYGSYLTWFVAGVHEGGADLVISTVRANAAESWLLLQDRLAAGFPPGIALATLLIVAAALVGGCVILARRAPVTVAFFILYVAIMLAWPYNPWRFAWAIWPLVGFLAATGIREAWLVAGRWRPVVVAVAMLPAFALLRVELHAYATRAWRGPAQTATHQITPVLDWIQRNVPPGETVLTEGEPVVALYGDRPASPPISFTAREYLSPPGVAEGAARLSEMLRAVPARYVMLLAPTTIESADALRDRHPGLARIASVSGAVAYRVTP